MIALVSVALAVSLTTGLGVMVSHHMDEQVGAMALHDSILVSGLGLERVSSSHALLYGMVSNDGTQQVSLESVKIVVPDSTVCNSGTCTLSAALDNSGSVCLIGGAPACDTCTISCALQPGESMSLGPSLHALGTSAGESYAIILTAQAEQGGAITDVRAVRAR